MTLPNRTQTDLPMQPLERLAALRALPARPAVPLGPSEPPALVAGATLPNRHATASAAKAVRCQYLPRLATAQSYATLTTIATFHANVANHHEGGRAAGRAKRVTPQLSLSSSLTGPRCPEIMAAVAAEVTCMERWNTRAATDLKIFATARRPVLTPSAGAATLAHAIPTLRLALLGERSMRRDSPWFPVPGGSPCFLFLYRITNAMITKGE